MKNNAHLLPRLFEDWPRIAAKLQPRRPVVVFLDFDGTLVKIARRPNLVRLQPETRRILEKISRNPRGTVVIISGRRREEIQRLIGLHGLTYLGLYGWEKKNSVRLTLKEQIDLMRAHLALKENLAGKAGVWIEQKTFSLSVHLRESRPADKKSIHRSVKRALQPLRSTLRLRENIRDLEVVPRSACDKGEGVRSFLAAHAARGAVPIFFGDDFSDEPAFAAVGRGIPVLVGRSRKTYAKFRLRGPAEVTQALCRLEEALQ